MKNRRRQRRKRHLLNVIAEVCVIAFLMAFGVVFVFLWAPVSFLQNPESFLAVCSIGSGLGLGLYFNERYREHRRKTAVSNVKRDLARRARLRGSLLAE